MMDSPNADEIEEYDDVKQLSLEGLLAAEDEPGHSLAMLKSLNPKARQTSLDELASDLAHFESQYGMTSSEFNERFESGELGDAMDYFDWSATFRMYTRIRNEQRASE